MAISCNKVWLLLLMKCYYYAMINVLVLSLFSLWWSITFLLTIIFFLIIFKSVTNKLGVDAKISCSATFE